MSSNRQSNVYSSTAHELQNLSDQTEEAKVYHEAVQLVLSKPANKEAGPQERDLVLTPRTLEELLQALSEKKEQSQAFGRKPSGIIWRSSKAIVENLGRFDKAITSMAQAKPEVAMLIWGPIQFLVIDIFDTLDRLNEIGERLENCLARFKYHTIGDHVSGPLRGLLVKFYTHIIQFSITASQTYRRSRLKTAARVFRKSIKAPLEQFLERLSYLSDEIHKTHTAKSLHDIKEAQRRSLQPVPRMRSCTKNSEWGNADSVGQGICSQPEISQGQTIRIVPDLLSNSFAGREEALTSIRRCLPFTLDGKIRKAAVWGTPGIGKTQIALRFEERYRDQYRHIFFVNATSSATIVTDYRQIAQRLKIPRPDQGSPGESDIVEALKTWLAKCTSWLMIFDNALEPGTVRRYSPDGGLGHILFTTRSQITARALVERANVCEILPLQSGEAVELALKLQNFDNAHVLENQAAARLAHMVGGLPIAIEQTVSLACLRKVSLSTVLPEVEKKRTFLKQAHPLSMHENGSSTGAILALTLDTLKAQSPQAHALFRLLVYLSPSSIPKDVITQGSSELKHHFLRQETYDRGFEQSAKERHELRLKAALARLPWYYQDPFEADFWKSRIPFRNGLPGKTLPRIDSEADRHVERYFHGNGVLREVLEKQVRIENAFLDLRQAGLIRYPNDKTIWIHDLFAQLTVALMEEESRAIHQATAHMVLLMLYFLFPIPNYSENRRICFEFLPHAVSVLTHCKSFYNDLTIGPELAHLIASTFSKRIFKANLETDESALENAISYYKLAIVGYQHAWRRLREHPLVTEKKVILCARAEYADAYEKGKWNIYSLHYQRDYRFGSSAATRVLQTCLKLGAFIYPIAGRYDEAVRWTDMAVKGLRGIYGDYHDETSESRAALIRLYKCSNLWIDGYVLARVRAQAHMERYEGGLISTRGARMASDIGDCAMGLGDSEDAIRWYGITLRAWIDLYGDNDRSQVIILLKLATVEGFQCAHGKSLRLARKGLKIYEDTNRTAAEGSRMNPARLIDIEVVIALQQFELGNAAAAKDGCERALRACEWHPKIDTQSFSDYRSVWDSALQAVWIWGCVEFDGDNKLEQWSVPTLRVTEEFTREALMMYGQLRGPCCGKRHGSEGWNPGGGVQKQMQQMLKELEEAGPSATKTT